MLLSCRTEGGKIAIQFKSGWTTGICTGVEEGKCKLHFQDNIGWVWMNIHFDDEGTSGSYLCELGWEAYGESEENTWCILVPGDE